MSETDWRSDVSSSTSTLKIKDSENARFVFQDEGTKRNSIDYGDSIAFLVRCDGDQDNKTLFVKANNYSFLADIKKLGESLRGLHVEVSRKGSKKSDTRYSIKVL